MQAAAGRDRHQQLLHRAHQRRHARGPQLQRRCLQPLAVQHIVQDLPQHLRSITHGHQHLPLAMIQITASQPLEHAQQGAHRRADLWLMVARKWLLASAACSAARRASASATARACASLTSNQ
jgi:hypothetical protein